MTERKCPSRRSASKDSLRGWLFRNRKVLLSVIGIAKFLWRVVRLLFGDDPWTFYFSIRNADAT